MLGGIGNVRGVVFSGKAREGVRQHTRRWNNYEEGRGNSKLSDEREPPDCLLGTRAGQGGAADVFGVFFWRVYLRAGCDVD